MLQLLHVDETVPTRDGQCLHNFMLVKLCYNQQNRAIVVHHIWAAVRDLTLRGCLRVDTAPLLMMGCDWYYSSDHSSEELQYRYRPWTRLALFLENLRPFFLIVQAL